MGAPEQVLSLMESSSQIETRRGEGTFQERGKADYIVRSSHRDRGAEASKYRQTLRTLS